MSEAFVHGHVIAECRSVLLKVYDYLIKIINRGWGYAVYRLK